MKLYALDANDLIKKSDCLHKPWETSALFGLATLLWYLFFEVFCGVICFLQSWLASTTSVRRLNYLVCDFILSIELVKGTFLF